MPRLVSPMAVPTSPTLAPYSVAITGWTKLASLVSKPSKKVARQSSPKSPRMRPQGAERAERAVLRAGRGSGRGAGAHAASFGVRAGAGNDAFRVEPSRSERRPP